MARRPGSRPHPTIALCGAGMISAAHAAAAQLLGLRIIAVASRTRERAAGVAHKVGAAVAEYDDLPAGADIVVVETPPAQHTVDTLRALRAGAAVVVEKPLCRTLAEADELVGAADASGHRVLYAENLAYAPVVQEFVRRTRRIGSLSHLVVRAVNPLPTWGGFTTDEWGGGALFDLGVHPLAVAVLAAAPARPRSVQARLEGSPTGAHGSDEHAEVVIEFDTGLRARVVASFRGGRTPLWDAEAASATGVVRAELLPAPSLEENGEPVPLPAPSGPAPQVEQYGYRGQLAAFVDDLAHHRRPVMDPAFGRVVLDLVCAAYTSARTGEAVPVPFAGPRDRTPLELWRGG